MLNIKCHTEQSKGNKAVVVSLDKDCHGCFGTSYYDFTQDKFEIVDVPVFGYLKRDYFGNKNKKVKGLGVNFLMYQILCGDSSDHYDPAMLHKQKFGDQTAVDYLNQASSTEELFALTLDRYQKWFPIPLTYLTHEGREVTKSAEEILELYFQAAYMKRSICDNTTFKSLWKELA